jgi:hypothetical protein
MQSAYVVKTTPIAHLLKFSHIVRSESKHISIGDQRRRVFYTLAAFVDHEGFEYRKSFESYQNPTIPAEGTHKQINALAIQY